MNDIEKAIDDLEDLKDCESLSSNYFKEIHGKNLELAISALEKQLTNGWIPASTPPEEDGTYIVAWLPLGCKSLCEYPHYYGLFTLSDGKFEVDVPEAFKGNKIIILAWQSLPESYKAN